MQLEVFIQASDGLVDLTLPDSRIAHLDTTTDGSNTEQIRLFIRSWCYLLADSPLSNGAKPVSVYVDFLKDIFKRPLVETITAYTSRIDHCLVTSTSLGSDSSTGVFSDQFFGTPIFREYREWFKTGRPDLLRFLMSFCYFGKKLRYEDPNLNAAAFHSWLKVEERLSGLVLDKSVCEALRLIIDKLLGPLSLDKSWPQFGPGAVAEDGVRGFIRKANNLKYDACLDRAFFGNHIFRGTEDHMTKELVPLPYLWSSASSRSSRTSRLMFVPKTVKTARSICMEPNSFMFFQQAFLQAMLSGMNGGYARLFIDLHDQSRNRALARYGSETKTIATIDLKAASDSVHLRLVEAVFPRQYLYYMKATRSSTVKLPDGSVTRVHKFAPMGSALCFPTQCIVFTAICILAAAQHASGLDPGSSVPNALRKNVVKAIRSFQSVCGAPYVRGKYEPLSVYGDDICVDTRLTPYVTYLLALLGFEVNDSKSFDGGQCFRESCGGYYFDGVDVTPLFFRVERSRGKIGPEEFMSLVSAINNGGDLGYRNYSGSLIRYIRNSQLSVARRSKDPDVLFFSSDRNASYAVYSTNPRNETHVVKTDRKVTSRSKNILSYNYQRDECKVLMAVPHNRKMPTAAEEEAVERYGYMRWYGVAERGLLNSVNTGFPRSLNLTHKLDWRWVPV